MGLADGRYEGGCGRMGGLRLRFDGTMGLSDPKDAEKV